MRNSITIHPHDDEGLFGLIIEGPGQAPFLIEMEGVDSSRASAEAAAEKILAGRSIRYCIVRLVPVAGNELLPLDMQRMQK